MFCWILTTPLQEGMRSPGVNSIDTGSQVKGKKHTHLLSNGKSLIYPPSGTQAAALSGDIAW